jgi:hypothetical protein
MTICRDATAAAPIDRSAVGVQARDGAHQAPGRLSSSFSYFRCGLAMPDFALWSMLNAISTQFSPA